MCMVDGADGYNEFSAQREHTARKPHRCEECGRTIHPGERYLLTCWKYEGDFSQARMCAHCQVAADWLTENCGGYLTHGVEEDLREHVSEYGGQTACWPRLARLAVQMDQNWTYRRGPRKGQLMPLPALPGKLEPHLHDH